MLITLLSHNNYLSHGFANYHLICNNPFIKAPDWNKNTQLYTTLTCKINIYFHEVLKCNYWSQKYS